MLRPVLLALSLFAGACSDSPTASTPPQDMDPNNTQTDMNTENDMPDETCDEDFPSTPGTNTWEDPTGNASVSVQRHPSCLRTYTLTTTAPRKDDLPGNPRVIAERQNTPILRTGNDLFDALYALAIDEVGELSVQDIKDGAFNNGEPVSCGGCFETGRKWNYVWTRDTAYALHLGLAALDPARALASLNFKLSERREGGDLQIVQDTGTGGSYPVSTDRVSWALGAEELLENLYGTNRSEFAARTLDALSNTLEHDRDVAFDVEDGLYRGETSFLDWREQSYAEWTAQNTVHIGTSKALSTNILHMRAMQLASRLANESGDITRATKYSEWASDLKTAIQERFWLEDEGLFSSFTNAELDGSPARAFDLLGSSLAVLSDVATAEQAKSILSRYPHYGNGAPVIFPQQQLTPIYHNRGEWPFVSAYWMRAARHANNHAVFDRMFHTLIRGAALNLSNMENFEAETGLPYREDGEFSGPVVNSQRQLWSVAGYISMVHQTLFGLQPTEQGLVIKPFITPRMAQVLFGGVPEIHLKKYPYLDHKLDIILSIPSGEFDGYEMESLSVDGIDLPSHIAPETAMNEFSTIRVQLKGITSATAHSHEVRNAANWREIFKPRTPQITGIRAENNRVVLDLSVNNEDPNTVTWTLYKNGIAVATDIPGTTPSWTDPNSDTNGSSSPCYAAELTFTDSKNHSQHSQPLCWWGLSGERVKSVLAADFTVVGGTPVTNHGRFHYEAWGDDGHTITINNFTPTQTGQHLLQAVYGNGAGGVTTGITCAVKRIVVEDPAANIVVGSGFLFMPHLGTWERWADSNTIPVELEAGRTYRIRITGDRRAINMSSFSHFESYTGGLGGTEGPFNRVNIAELKILAR